MEFDKIVIESDGEITKILLNDQEIKTARKVTFSHEAGELPQLEIKLLLSPAEPKHIPP